MTELILFKTHKKSLMGMLKKSIENSIINTGYIRLFSENRKEKNMSEKRRDIKGRVLRNGENQRKDGRYEYKYTDALGQRRSVYSWRLVDTDRLPNGKKDGASLRELEKEIEAELKVGLKSFEVKRLTVNQYFDYHMSRKAMKHNTKAMYIGMYDRHIRNTPFGRMLFITVKSSDIKNVLINIHKEKGLAQSTIKTLYIVVAQMFSAAVSDEYILKNPADRVMREVSKFIAQKPVPRTALTKRQQELFSKYVTENKAFKNWVPLVTFLLGTGCRIGEALALRWEDCDFEKNIIDINHSLVYTKINGKNTVYIGSTKSEAGIRIIPMLSEVKKVLLDERSRQEELGIESIEIDGYKNFVFITKNGKTKLTSEVDAVLYRIVNRYNEEELLRAEAEGREPELLPKISAHILRHTFCTRYCEVEHNIKVIKEVMGHAKISTTMMIYNTATNEEKMRSFAGLENTLQVMSDASVYDKTQ